MTIDNHQEEVLFDMINDPQHLVVLEILLIQTHNPQIDWSMSKVMNSASGSTMFLVTLFGKRCLGLCGCMFPICPEQETLTCPQWSSPSSTSSQETLVPNHHGLHHRLAVFEWYDCGSDCSKYIFKDGSFHTTAKAPIR